MSLKTRAALLLAIAPLSGCFQLNTSQAPLAKSWPLTEQQRMQAAHHWEVLARNEARAIMESQRLRERPLYVAPASTETPFSRGFHSLLESALVQQGGLVSTRPEGAVRVDYDVQVVSHNDRGFIRKPVGTFTALTSGIALATHPFNHWSEPALALIPGAALFDAFSGNLVEVGDTEVIITTRADEFDTLLHASSNIYYINAGDTHHYRVEETGGLRLSSQW